MYKKMGRAFDVWKNFKNIEKNKNQANTIYIYDFIVDSDDEAAWFGGVSSESIVKQLSDVVGDIHVRVNSPGGSVFGGRVIEQALREYKGSVIAHVDGLAASAASVLINGADKIIMGSGAFIMIHNAWTFAGGNSADLRKSADLLDKIDETIAQTYADKTGIEIKEIKKLLDKETWLSAPEAVALGFADDMHNQESKNQNSNINDKEIKNQLFISNLKRKAEARIVAGI